MSSQASKSKLPNKSRRAPKPKKAPSASKPKTRTRTLALLNDFSTHRNGGLERMKDVLVRLTAYLSSDPTRVPGPRIIAFLKRAQHHYELAVKASIGMPGFSDCVTTQSEGPKDIPTVPLSGFQLIKRVCYIAKPATLGTAAGGFFATLFSVDLAPFVGTSNFYRVSKITSWTVPRQDGSVNQGTFAGVSVPAGDQTLGTENLPIWSENFTPVGQGFASIVTHYPLGDFPQYAVTGTSHTICNHFTSLGNTGGVTNIPVVFHVEIETLI